MKILLCIACMVVSLSCAVGSNTALHWKRIGLEHKESGRYAEAEEAFKRAIEIKPHDVELHNNLGRVYFKSGQYAKAVESFKKAVELKPNAVGAYNNLAESYARLERFDEAIKIFLVALERKPNDPQTRFGLGVVFAMKGDREAALEQYKALRRLDPKRAEKLFELILK